jgi:hypothetical protein
VKRLFLLVTIAVTACGSANQQGGVYECNPGHNNFAKKDAIATGAIELCSDDKATNCAFSWRSYVVSSGKVVVDRTDAQTKDACQDTAKSTCKCGVIEEFRASDGNGKIVPPWCSVAGQISGSKETATSTSITCQ